MCDDTMTTSNSTAKDFGQVLLAAQALDHQPAPNVRPILSIHRAEENGYVRFARRLDDDQWQNLPAISTSKLERMFPQFADELMRDSYLGINTLWRPNNDRLTRLNACWADIDLHSVGAILSLGQIIGRAIDMVRAGALPRPSITVYSGRGVWFLWLLVDASGSRPKAYPEKVLLHEEINRELSRRRAHAARSRIDELES